MPKNPFSRKSEPKAAEPEPVKETPAPKKAKAPLDCPECDLPINHAGPHA